MFPTHQDKKMDHDFLSSLLDEVALEGLDGITLSMLWIRLQNRPCFPIALDNDSKIFLWECIAIHRDIEIFELNISRELVPIYNRYEHIDSELGIVLENPENLIDSYPIEFVNDGNIRGSCSTYKSRTCITSEIRYDDVLLMSLSQINEKWGEKLVLVASPKARYLALTGTEANPLYEMSREEYCLLERIGRSRYLGEVTQGAGGLLRLKAPFCKQLHYYRKKLTLKGLVSKQLHYMKNSKGQATTGSLFHITRFYVQRKTKMESLMKCMCDILKEKSQNREISRVLRDELKIKENTFKKLFYRPFQKWVKTIIIPYKDFSPEATLKEKFTSNGQERLVKVVQLLKHCDEADNIEDDEVNDEKGQFLPLNVHFDCSKLYYDLPLMSQVYRIIQDAGPEGLTLSSIGRIITLPRLDVRTLLKTLIKKNLVVTVLHERGRQKETKYIAKNIIVQNESYFKIKEREQELNQEKLPVNEPHKRRKLKRKHPDSLENVDTLANKKVRFNDEIDEVLIQDNPNTGEEINFQKIVTEVSVSDVFTGKAPTLINLSEKMVNPTILSSACQITMRKLKRINMVLDNLKSVGLSTLPDLQKHLTDKEREEGYNFKLDKKSTARMIHKLYLAKRLKIIKAVLKLDKKKTVLEFICDNSIELNDSRVQIAIDQAKFKFFSSYRIKSKPDVNINKSMSSEEKPTDEIKEAPISLTAEKRVYDSQTHPKCLRFKTLHKFLFYLIYNYEGHSGHKSDEFVVYHDSMSWKRFVPPLSPREGANREGWCYLADIYARMPLSIFVKVINLRHRIKEFFEYLEDEEKSHYLITFLPQDLLISLLSNRKYLFAFDDVLKCLCYMGLITFGPQISKLKEKVHLYVHKKVAFKDTTISPPGYIHINSDLTYEKKIFSLNTVDDVEKFWIGLESVCFHTPLGKYSSVAGKTIAIAEACHKPELMEALKNRSFEDINDVGHIPGDGLGAGGFDSSLFLHSRRNWQSSNSVKNSEKSVKIISKANPTVSIQNLLKNKEMSGPEGCSRLQRLNRYRLSSQKDKTLKENALKKKKIQVTTKKNKDSAKSSIPTIMPKKRRRIKFRTVKMRNKKIRQPYFDEKDRVAMQKMSRARCEWSSQEDSFLLLCKVASSFLDPTFRTLVVPYTVVRDLLHEKFPVVSANKSSRACQRRVRYMMMNPTTANNVAVFLGEARQDKNLVKEFDKVKPVKTNEVVWRKLFTGVLKRLLEKFTLPAAYRCQNICLPDSMEIFNKTFEIMSPRNVFHRKNNHKDPECEDEVKYFTLYSLIVSTMALVQDGTEWSYLLHKLYQVYPEYVLRSVVSRLRSEKVIAIKKRACKKDLQRSLVSTFPYRFSITYENAMLTKFPIKLFNESKELIDILKSKDNKDGIELKVDVAPGYAAAVLALVSLNELELFVKVPEQIIIFDSSLSMEIRSNIVERMINTLSDKESVELSRLLNNEKNACRNENKSVHSLSDNLDKDTAVDSPEDISKKLESDTCQTNEIHRSTNASRFALYLLRQELSQPPIERVQHSQDYIVLNSCKVFCNMTPHVNIQTSSSNATVSQNVPNLTKNVSEHRAKILTDGCISEIKESLTVFIPSEAFTEERNFDESLEKIYDAYSPQTLNDAKSIFEEILKANVTGISEKDIWKKFRVLSGELSLFEHLHLFREALLVIRAGVTSFVYVCICYAKSWTMTSYMMPEICYKSKLKRNEAKNFDCNSFRNVNDCEIMYEQDSGNSSQTIDRLQTLSNEEDCNFILQDMCPDGLPDQTSLSNVSLQDPAINFSEKVNFLPRTWRHPDGTLNKTAFIELLQTVLSYIISSPGVNTLRVTERFSLALQPIQTLELIEILEKACCITKYYCKKPSKRTLFSNPVNICITKNPDPDDLDHLESLPDAVCNLTRIQEAIM